MGPAQAPLQGPGAGGEMTPLTAPSASRLRAAAAPGMRSAGGGVRALLPPPPRGQGPSRAACLLMVTALTSRGGERGGPLACGWPAEGHKDRSWFTLAADMKCCRWPPGHLQLPGGAGR